jgi:hypothetical protein
LADLVNNFLIVSVEDAWGKPGSCKVRVAKKYATMKKAETLKDFVKLHSDAKVTAYGARVGIEDTVDSGAYDAVQQRLGFNFKSSTNQAVKFSYPAPRDEDVGERQQPTSDVAEDVRDLLNGFGKNIPATGGYNGGSMTGRPYKEDEREKELTGV